jgi:hypothetical protein
MEHPILVTVFDPEQCVPVSDTEKHTPRFTMTFTEITKIQL